MWTADEKFHGIYAAFAVDAFYIVAANNLLKEMKLLLSDGVALNSLASFSGRNALQTAAGCVHIRGVELLIELNPDINVADRND